MAGGVGLGHSQKSTAMMSCWKMKRATSSGSFPPAPSRYCCRVVPGTYSITTPCTRATKRGQGARVKPHAAPGSGGGGMAGPECTPRPRAAACRSHSRHARTHGMCGAAQHRTAGRRKHTRTRAPRAICLPGMQHAQRWVLTCRRALSSELEHGMARRPQSLRSAQGPCPQPCRAVLHGCARTRYEGVSTTSRNCTMCGWPQSESCWWFWISRSTYL